MDFDFSQVKSISIPVKVGGEVVVKEVGELDIGGEPAWGGERWAYTINIGDYVQKVKYSTDEIHWTSITSSTEVETREEDTLYIVAEEYNTDDVYNTYTPHNFSVTRTIADADGSVTIYQTAERVYYTSTITAGSYVQTIKAKVEDGEWCQASSSATITHLYEDTVYWAAVSYNESDAQYTYTGTLSGNFTDSTGESVTVSQTRTVNEYTITLSSIYGHWENSSGTQIASVSSPYGTTISSNSNVLTIGSDNYTFVINTATVEYSYSFDEIIGIPGSGTITEAITVTGKAIRRVQEYTITLNSTYGHWENSSGTTVTLADAEYGTLVSVNSNVLTIGPSNYTFIINTDDNHYHYTFDSISGSVIGGYVRGSSTVVGAAARELQKHTITLSSTYGHWENASGATVSSISNVVYGTSISSSSNVLTIGGTDAYTFIIEDDTQQYDYSFDSITGIPSGGQVIEPVTIGGVATRVLQQYQITYKYITSVSPQTYGYLYETFNYGDIPYKGNPSPMEFKDQTTGEGISFHEWDDITTPVTGPRTIEATYYDICRIYINKSGWCTCSHQNNQWYIKGGTVTFTADTNYAYSYDSTTGTVVQTENGGTITQGNQTFTSAPTWCNVTYVTRHSTPNRDDGWTEFGTVVTFTSIAPYCFDNTNNKTTLQKTVGASGETHNIFGYADDILRYTLSISVTNPTYGTCSVTRTSSPNQGASTGALSDGAAIYYGDVLTGSATAQATQYDPWPTVSAPSATSTGAATSGNLTVKNNDSGTCTLYYNTSNTTGGTSLGSASSGSSKSVSGLSFNSTYYISAKGNKSRNVYTYSVDSAYSGTASVSGDVAASFVFSGAIGSESSDRWSSVASAKTSAQSNYTITWKWQSDYGTWTTATETYAYGATPSRSSPPSVTSGGVRQRFSSWNNLSIVTSSRTIQATYIQQYYATISSTRCSANRSSDYYDTGTIITWTASTNCAFNSSGSLKTQTSTISSEATYSASADYVYATSFSGTHCSTTASVGWYAYHASFTWTASTGYAFANNADSTTGYVEPGSNTATASYTKYFTIRWQYMSTYDNWTSATSTCNYGASPSRSDPGTVRLGSDRYRSDSWDDTSAVYGDRTITRQYTQQHNITVSSSYCSCNRSSGWNDHGCTITWTANTDRAFDSSGTTTYYTYVNTAGTYSATASYYYMRFVCTNCTASHSNGWYSGSYSGSFIASTYYVFGLSSKESTYSFSGPTTLYGTAHLIDINCFSFGSAAFSGNNRQYSKTSYYDDEEGEWYYTTKVYVTNNSGYNVRVTVYFSPYGNYSFDLRSGSGDFAFYTDTRYVDGANLTVSIAPYGSWTPEITRFTVPMGSSC